MQVIQTPLLLTLTTKKCACCGRILPTTCFTRANHRNKVGFYSYCKECKHAKESEYYKANRDYCRKLARNRNLKSYGLTYEATKRLLEEQHGKCAICGADIKVMGERKSKSVHVDHDHATGFVRGLLCQACNTGLGGFRDDTLVLKSAIRYLEESREKQGLQK